MTSRSAVGETAVTAEPMGAVLPALLPLMAVVLSAFLVIGLALPVLPLQVRDGLGFGPIVVGLVTGSQFAAAVLSRVWAGRTCDRSGPKPAVMLGLVGAAVAGALYLLSVPLSGRPVASVVVLLAGRAVLGGAESFIITGATVWGLARAGSPHAGTVIAWMGTAMFTAFAVSAPVGTALYATGGFGLVAALTCLAPLPLLLLVLPLGAAAASGSRGSGMVPVLRSIWLPGVGAALSSVGFGAIVSFATLLYSYRGWTPIWLAFTSYAGALIVARLLFGHLPDRLGGAKVALYCVFIEAAGLVVMGLSSSAWLAATGAALTGIGYALVYPGLGAEAVRRAPANSHGLAMAAFTACLDLALGVSGPVLGVVGATAGLGTIYLASALAVLAAAPFAARLLRPA